MHDDAYPWKSITFYSVVHYLESGLKMQAHEIGLNSIMFNINSFNGIKWIRWKLKKKSLWLCPNISLKALCIYGFSKDIYHSIMINMICFTLLIWITAWVRPFDACRARICLYVYYSTVTLSVDPS